MLLLQSSWTQSEHNLLIRCKEIHSILHTTLKRRPVWLRWYKGIILWNFVIASVLAVTSCWHTRTTDVWATTHFEEYKFEDRFTFPIFVSNWDSSALACGGIRENSLFPTTSIIYCKIYDLIFTSLQAEFMYKSKYVWILHWQFGTTTAAQTVRLGDVLPRRLFSPETWALRGKTSGLGAKTIRSGRLIYVVKGDGMILLPRDLIKHK